MWRSFIGLTIVAAVLFAAPRAMASGPSFIDLIAGFANGSDIVVSTAPYTGYEATGSYFTRMFAGQDRWTSLPLGIVALVIVLVVAFKAVRNLFRPRPRDPAGSSD